MRDSAGSDGARPLPSGRNRRQAYEARQYRRSVTIASISTIAAIAALVTLVPLAPGWSRVRESFFNWEILVKTFPALVEAFFVDLAIFMWCAPIIAVWSLALALMRDVRSPAMYPMKLFAIGYNDLFRGVPVILVAYLFGFGIPGLGLPRPWNSPYIWGSAALILSYSAYVSEIFRSGIESIHESQRAASKSLGLSEADMMRFVILPQAIRRVMPACMTLVVALVKDVALLSFLGPVEVLRQAGSFKSLYANFTPYVGAAILFLIVTVPATRWVDSLIARQNLKQR
jgi:polar amino acid transport system permease protein